MDCLVIGYVPPSGVGYPESFLKNIGAYKTTFELCLFSDYPQWGLRHSENPARVKNVRFPYFVSNFVWLLALQYAMARQCKYFLFLEPDCRVRTDEWDGRMFEEANKTAGFLSAGSTVIYNISGSGHSTLKRATDYCHAILHRTNIAVPIYGFERGIKVYSNGAGAIYETAVMGQIFRHAFSDMGRAACSPEAFDMQTGRVLYQIYGDAVFDLVVGLKCSYSACGEELTTERDRLAMLANGEKVLIHQCKTGAI